VTVQIHKLRRFDTDCYIAVLDAQAVRIKIAYPFDTVTGAAQKHKADLAVNMGGWGLWPNESEPNEYLVIEGVVKQHKSYDSRPCIEITRDNQIKFHERPSLTKCWNVWGFDRFIARHGEFNARIYNKKAVAPRTVYGVDIHGNLVVMVCEGRQADQKGLTFPECWEVMREFNCTDVGNADGGGSSAFVYKGELLNSTYRKEYRRVVSQLLVYFDTNEEVPQSEEPKEFRMKGVLRQGTNNVKSGSTIVAQMMAGDWVFGDLSTTGSDLIGFDHFYRANSSRFNVPAGSKVTVANMTITQENETTPEPQPEVEEYIEHVKIVGGQETRRKFGPVEG
jgi:hypothetical protein